MSPIEILEQVRQSYTEMFPDEEFPVEDAIELIVNTGRDN